MIKKLLSSFDSSTQEYNSAKKIAEKVMEQEPVIQELSDEQLQNKFEEFKARYNNGESLESLLIEAYAVVREASFRLLKMKPFFVQIIGGIVLHHGNIAEMKTGEGKTLTSTMPAYLNAIAGKGVHIITVNEYLATREAEGEIGDLFRFLGLTVGLNIHDLSPAEKQEVYNCDIVYSTNNEVGFDYLRDNMAIYSKDRVQQRGLYYAIIDEVDSVLIDEARTPLIISGGATKSLNLYMQADQIAKVLVADEDYDLDVKTKTISLTKEGITKCENMFGVDNLYDLQHSGVVHHLHQALKANYVMEKGHDYIIDNDEILIVDPHTGRSMPGRAFSEGLHQAIEAKEGVQVKEETRTMATITFQNLFRMYEKLSGMTGTAKTEEEEFREIYNMYVVSIPTNKPIARVDHTDLIFANLDAKMKNLIRDVKEIHSTGQPILIGTVSVESSEYLSKQLTKAGLKHELLNAKNHFREADIIALAGERNAITLATNMAGRGTDIKLGEGVRELGGLYVIGTERHESRRIDNQLRGRSGRQGDPGTSQFYVSFDDALMVRFGSLPQKIFEKSGLTDEALQSKIYSRSIESAQKQVEGNNYDTRKRVLQYDEVMSSQRKIMYKLRNEILDCESYHENMVSLISKVIHSNINNSVFEEGGFNSASIEKVEGYINSHYLETPMNISNKNNQEEFTEEVIETVLNYYEDKVNSIEDDSIRNEFEKVIALRVFDTHWIKQIDTMAHLKEGIGLRSYAQQNPLREYTMEGKKLFDEMMYNIEKDAVQFCLRSQVRANTQRTEVIKGKAVQDAAKENVKKQPKRSSKIKVNDPCICGSGKKYKHCCGKN